MGLIWDLFRLPRRWRRQLQILPFPRLLGEIEEEARRSSDLSLPPGLIKYLVKRRVKASKLWKPNRCLLAGALLAYFLPRAGYEVTLHVGCKIIDGKLTGHCWISSPELSGRDFYFDDQGNEEMIARRVSPGLGRKGGFKHSPTSRRSRLPGKTLI